MIDQSRAIDSSETSHRWCDTVAGRYGCSLSTDTTCGDVVTQEMSSTGDQCSLLVLLDDMSDRHSADTCGNSSSMSSST